MTVFNIICSDPCWSFSDQLTMDSVKRGASSQYKLLSNKEIKSLDVKSIAADDAVLALWVPSSLLKEGIETMESWGFDLKQTHIWVKVKKEPLGSLLSGISKIKSVKDLLQAIQTSVLGFDLQNILYFGMGRLFRQTHEIVLVGTRGKVYKHLANKSQRSVHFAPIGKHSKKPETLQDMLDTMFPDKTLNKLEMFARRNRDGWTCIGLESPSSMGEDIRDSIERLKSQ